MPNTRRVLSFAVGLTLVAIVLACGGPGDEPPGTTGSSASTLTSETRADDTSSPPTASSETPATDDHRFGPPLAAPSRYYGLYASPDRPDRQWFIAEAKRPKWAEQAPEIPPGHLALGAMFGDVSPWTLKTLSDTEFVQAWAPDGQPEPVAIEFELDADGNAVAFRFTDDRNATLGRLERQGDLPEDWE